MKCTTLIDPEREEEVVIYLQKESNISKLIEELVALESCSIVGYDGDAAVKLAPNEILAVYVENGKVYADTENGKLMLKRRLYVFEELLCDSFVKINQSCIVRVSAIKRFDVSFGGALMVSLSNGRKDYVSRRQVKAVKERIGI